MRTIRTVTELRAALAVARREHTRVGLVPTMGAFHDGHRSLMRRAREECDVVVVSLFVNPSQFNEGADLRAYPRDERADAASAAELGVDYLFAPDASELYPNGFDTTVSVGRIGQILEGAHRGRAHFDAVATVVTKLLVITSPDAAYFGQKDAQQVLVIKQLIRDLNLPVELVVCPTVRDLDGVALSSRNLRLTPADREQARALKRALDATRDLVSGGEDDVARLQSEAVAELTGSGAQVDYFQIVDPATLAPLTTVAGPALAVVAASVGGVRLIDNQPIT